METTRFLVALTRIQDSACRVEKHVRRSDQNRVVFYVTNWLLQTQRLINYFGVTYNMYEIYKQDDTGQWVQVETGGVSNAETRRSSTRPEAAKGKAPIMDQEGRGNQGRKRGTATPVRDEALTVTDRVLGTSKQFRRSKALSPFQQRVKAELELARQRLAEQKAKGDS